MTVAPSRRTPGPARLVFVLSDLSCGGAQRVAVRAAGALAAHGHAVTILTLGPTSRDFFPLHADVSRVGLDRLGPSPTLLHGLLANLGRLRALRNALAALRPDGILSFVTATNVLTVLATRGTGWRVVVSERNDPARQPLSSIWRLLVRLVYPRATLVTANSHAALHSLSQRHGLADAMLLPNPPPPAKASRRDPGKTILTVGRLHPQKAQDDLIRAFARAAPNLPGWDLKLAGAGPEREALARLAMVEGVADRVHVLGEVADLEALFGSSALFALPSRYEGTPNALMEAMAAGLPCIVSDGSAGPLALVQDGVNGVVVPVGAVDHLAGVLSALARDPASRARLGAAARNSAASWPRGEVVAVWEQVLLGPSA